MYAVIKTGGKQYKVASGDTLKIETVAGDVGSTIEFADVLMMVDGDTTHIGEALQGALVKAEVVSHGRGKKIRIVKHRRRKHYHKEQGHRQNFTEVKFTELLGGSK